MALKLIVYLAILKLALSVPDPDPDLHIYVNINKVEKKGCCQGPKPESSIGKHLDDLSTHELWLHILYQFDRPYEHRHIYRGDRNYTYYLDTEAYDPNEPHVPIIIPTMKDFTNGKGNFKYLLNYPKGRHVKPSMFAPGVRDGLNELHKLYKENPGAKGTLRVAVNARDHVNEFLHHNLLHSVVAHDHELVGIHLPAFYEVIPEIFGLGCNKTSECCKIDEYLPNLTEDEWKVSYWREEADINNFHGGWHYYNPTFGNVPLPHGELSYYFHNQLVARYNMERLSNRLELVTALDPHNWNSNYLIKQNYIPPVLTDTLKRCANMKAEPLHILSSNWTELKEDILKEILELNATVIECPPNLPHCTNYSDNSLGVHLKNNDGINYVACALQNANCGELDVTKYGGPCVKGIHYSGHIIMGGIGCPNDKNTIGGLQEIIDNHCMENYTIYMNYPNTKLPGVMANEWTTVRDPLFFRWHKFVDNVYQLHKETLDEYNLSNLTLDGVVLSSIAVNSTRSEGQLSTFNSTLNMEMWFDEYTTTCINQPSVGHHPFTYKIIADNNYEGGKEIDVTVRIYLAPKLNPALNYTEIRTLWALMDVFPYKLTNGTNTIWRDSCRSSITTPRPKSIKEITNNYKDEESFNEFKYTFEGPFINKTWGDEDNCNQTWDIGTQNLTQCMSNCLNKPEYGCTAINYNPNTNKCTLRNCTSSVPQPGIDSPSLDGYVRRAKPTTCSCGLPEHLLIPRGTPDGMNYQLFIYITLRDNLQICPNQQECSVLCNVNYTRCDQTGEPLGFPFDRPLTTLDGDSITYIEDLANKLPNAKLHDIEISYNKHELNNSDQCSDKK